MSLRLSGGRRLQSPAGDTARPTPARVRLAVMNILASRLPGCRWLDLCCGSGVMACEALQRGAALVVAVDRHRAMLAVARANLAAVASGLPESRFETHAGEVLRWLQRGRGGQGRFDLIYADPPYAAGLQAPIAAAVLKGDWLEPGGILLLECSSGSVPEAGADNLAGWCQHDQRRYGGTIVLMLTPA